MLKIRSPYEYAFFDSPTSIRISHGDGVAFLQSIESESVDVLFLDPPFNLGKSYGAQVKDHVPVDSYERWLRRVLLEGVRTLAVGGALYLYHLPAWALRVAPLLTELLEFRHWIAISMKNGFVRGERLYPAHYSLLYFTKGAPSHFTRPKLQIQRCKCGRPTKDYGGYRQIVEQKGINLSDVWDDLSPVRHSNRKTRSANELPVKLVNRVLTMSGFVGGEFVDPFSGSGTAVVEAIRSGMHTQSCDAVITNCRLLKSRVNALLGEEFYA